MCFCVRLFLVRLRSIVLFFVDFRFTPDILESTATTGLLCLGIEVGILRLSILLLNLNTDASLIDLVAYCGYKFVPAVLILCVGLALSNIGFYPIYFYLATACSAFMMYSFRKLVARPAQATHRISRTYFIFFAMLTQFVVLYILCNIDFAIPETEQSV